MNNIMTIVKKEFKNSINYIISIYYHLLDYIYNFPCVHTSFLIKHFCKNK